jgi:hypothetical protein
MTNKNKFTNAFASALNRGSNGESQTSKRLNIQTSEHPNVQTFERLGNEENITTSKQMISTIDTTKKKSLKDQGWVPTTIYLPKKLKEKLKIKSTKEGRDMSEIIFNLIENKI